MSARSTCTEPPTASWPSASPRTVRSASIDAVIRSLASGLALRAVKVRSTGIAGAITPTLPAAADGPCAGLGAELRDAQCLALP